MATVDREALKRLQSLSKCCICLMTYKDPRMLPCFHSACLKCLQDVQSKNENNPSDVLPCPLCKKEFTIPPDGLNGLQKNFFIESLIEVTKTVSIDRNLKRKAVPCNMCTVTKEGNDVTEATIRCLNCRECYCLTCSKMHKSQKLAKDHKIVEIDRELKEEEIREMIPTRNCKRHSEKALDYYCKDCKTVVCVSCFVEDHKLHECKDVTTVDKEFRQQLQESFEKMPHYSEDMLSKKMDIERQKRQFLEKTLEAENAIRNKSQQLKTLIDQHEQAVLDELHLLKKKHQENFEIEIEEIERKLIVLESFVTYCTELKSKGSPSEVCDCAENLITRAKELNKENEEYLSAPSKSVEVKFAATDEASLLQNANNVIGKLSELKKEFERFTIVIGISDGNSISKDVIKINLNRSEVVSYLKQIPIQMQMEAAAAVYCNSIFITGIGWNSDEIRKFDATSSKWNKCAYMVQGRRRHSVAFVDHVLYICGGWVWSNKSTLDDVEAYDAIDDKCTTVGKLVYAVESASNCVPFKDLLYIFGGCDANLKNFSDVQVYNTKSNTCSLLSNPMPRANRFLRAALWENSVIVLGWNCCFIYNFDKETWEMRDQFKTDIVHFGMIANNGKIFVIGGGDSTTDADGKTNWICIDDIRYIPVMNILNDKPTEWKHHSKLPKPSLVQAFVKMDLDK